MLPPLLHYQKFGTGARVWLAFHGFGQDSTVFAEFVQVLPNSTIYSIDLFFHGQSVWHGPLDGLTYVRWEQLVQAFLTQHHIANFSLLGYSMGGRLALVTYMRLPARVDELVLVAPDGIRPNAWYRYATRVPALHGVFRYVTAENPNPFHHAMHWAKKWRLLPKTLLKVAETQMSEPALRARVYRTWMLYRFLEPVPAQIGHLWQKRPIPVRIYTGRDDTVVKPTDMRPLVQALPHAGHVVLPCSHSRLLREVIGQLSSAH
jgi:pimeloyl-ACP methyl ester carboxylesterase